MTHRFRMVVRSPNWLGDAVMAVPAVRALKQGRPDLELTVLVPEKIADLWRQIPEVDRVLPLPPGGGILATAARLREEKFDAALLLPNSLRVGLEAWCAGIPRRVGVRGHSRSVFLNQLVGERRTGGEGGPQARHHVYHYLHLARSIGAPGTTHFELGRDGFSPGDGAGDVGADRAWFDGKKRDEDFQVAVCPGAEFGAAKRWFPERFAEVMRVVSETRRCRWHVVGVAKDQPVGERIEAAFASGAEGRVCVENWMGRTSLRELIALLRRCRVLLTNDTGTMHLAAVLGVPTVAVFGSTDPAATGPLGEGHVVVRHEVPCGPCFLRECPLDFACMEGVSVQEVVGAVQEKLTA
jgi:lipopolysaccharide heptosyltransferase II